MQTVRVDMDGTGKPACVISNALIDEDNEIVDCQLLDVTESRALAPITSFSKLMKLVFDRMLPTG